MRAWLLSLESLGRPVAHRSLESLLPLRLPSQHAMNATPQGKALRTASAFTALQATTAFFRLPLLESWFGAARRLLLARRPDVLLLTSFVAMSGAAALPDILGLPTRVVLAHTIPLHPTGEFGMPLAGEDWRLGFTVPAWMDASVCRRYCSQSPTPTLPAL